MKIRHKVQSLILDYTQAKPFLLSKQQGLVLARDITQKLLCCKNTHITVFWNIFVFSA